MRFTADLEMHRFRDAPSHRSDNGLVLTCWTLFNDPIPRPIMFALSEHYSPVYTYLQMKKEKKNFEIDFFTEMCR
jgi:hypothetical protein